MALIDDDPPPEPPPELILAWHCERWSALPGAGGLLDQDYGLIRRMAVYLNVHNTVSRLRNMTGEQIHQLTDTERKILKYLIDQGMIQNG